MDVLAFKGKLNADEKAIRGYEQLNAEGKMALVLSILFKCAMLRTHEVLVFPISLTMSMIFDISFEL